MIHQNQSMLGRYTNNSSVGDTAPDDAIDIDRIVGVVRRQWKLVAAAAIIGAFLGVIYLALATPSYKATSELLLDQGQGQLASEMTGLAEPARVDEAILSQVELLASTSVAATAADQLGLADNLEFLDSGRSDMSRFLNNFRQLLGMSVHSFANEPPDTRRSAAISLVQRNTSVSRVGRTYLLAVSYSAEDPQVAGDVANALASAYLTDQLNSKFEATRTASAWLEGRLEALRSESLTADLAVQKFRQENNLISADGTLVSDQQLAASSVDLTTARRATAEAKSRLDQIRSVIASGNPDATVDAALSSSLINTLRGRYVDAAARLASVVQLVGSDHERAREVQNEMNELQRLMQVELGRIAEGYESDYQVALANQQALQENLSSATATTASSNSTAAKLRELQSQASSLSNLYQTFLQSYQQSAQRASFPMTEARIIAHAGRPSRPSSPITPLVLAIGTVLGGTAGLGVAGVREFRDRFVRTAEHLRSSVGIEYLGMTPKLTGRVRVRRVKKGEGSPNQINPISGSVYAEVLDHPNTLFSEALRGVKVAADLALSHEGCKVIGMVSLLPEEGKSTISANLGLLLASIGGRALVIDADIRHPMLSRVMAPDAKIGLVDVLLYGASLQDTIHYDERSGLHMLPVGSVENIPNSADLLSSQGFIKLILAAREFYDYVVLDLPPIAPVSDARAVSGLVDAFVFVVQWGRIPRQFLRNMLQREDRIADKVLGVVLNKVDMDKLKLYRTSDSSEYYASSYAKYFRDAT